jgi:hypothetical protein
LISYSCQMQETPANAQRASGAQSVPWYRDRQKRAGWKSEFVTPLSKYLDPENPDQRNTARKRLWGAWGSVPMFYPTIYATAVGLGEEVAPTVVRMISEEFVFLDVGAWLDGHNNERKRDFGVIWGGRVYLCKLSSTPDWSQAREEAGPIGGRPLDEVFFSWMGGDGKLGLEVVNWTYAPGSDGEFEWDVLNLIIPDLHLLDEATKKIWRGGDATFKAEEELLAFVKRVLGHAELAKRIRLVQIGDCYDLIVGRRCLFKQDTDEHRVLPVEEEGVRGKESPGQWAPEVLDMIATWVAAIRNPYSSPEKTGKLNPAIEALELASVGGRVKETVFIYGNHDNYLSSKDVCIKAKLKERVRSHALQGVLLEHGHRMESFFVGQLDSNSDGAMGGYLNVLMVYLGRMEAPKEGTALTTWKEAVGLPQGRKRFEHEVDYDKQWRLLQPRWGLKLASGVGDALDKLAVTNLAGASQQAQYWGEMAQTWVGRRIEWLKRADDAPMVTGRPPQIFVIGHTHAPRLLNIVIN